MCGGQRRAHHRAQEGMREQNFFTNMANEQIRLREAEQARMASMQADADRRQQEALRAIAESSKQPFKLRTAAEAATPLLKTKQKTAQAQRGVSSLRIGRTPGTNIGMGQGGTNIG